MKGKWDRRKRRWIPEGLPDHPASAMVSDCRFVA